jgi:hypothetical protein
MSLFKESLLHVSRPMFQRQIDVEVDDDGWMSFPPLLLSAKVANGLSWLFQSR